MERTAMQELIEWIEVQREKHLIPTPYQIQIKAQDLLAQEREQIVEAFDSGISPYGEADGEEYYSDKYEQK